MAIMKRMLPPLNIPAGGIVSQPVNGRCYPGVSSTTVMDVPDFDAELLAQQAGWSLTSWCPCGPTADRPTKLPNEAAWRRVRSEAFGNRMSEPDFQEAGMRPHRAG